MDHCTTWMWYDTLTTNYRLLAKCAPSMHCVLFFLFCCMLPWIHPNSFKWGPSIPLLDSPVLAETDMRNTCAKMINKELVDAGEQNSTWQQLARPSGNVQFGSTVGPLAPPSHLPITKAWWFWKWWADTGLQQKVWEIAGRCRTVVWSWFLHVDTSRQALWNFMPSPAGKCWECERFNPLMVHITWDPFDGPIVPEMWKSLLNHGFCGWRLRGWDHAAVCHSLRIQWSVEWLELGNRFSSPCKMHQRTTDSGGFQGWGNICSIYLDNVGHKTYPDCWICVSVWK